ncbi:MAG: sulfite exporter TauE/SafE family protein [Candidatus Lokiarchaeota archaeon]|nr:sulfite exporter TauE/SafE family protein [Candidatus Lokiarchaeota archaeon]
MPMEVSFFLISLLLILGLLSGAISAIAGIGGGVFFVSLMTLLFFVPINIAVDTSTFIILFSSLAGFITYLRQKRTTFKLTLIFSSFSILGSILASIVFSIIIIDNSILKLLFAGILLIAGFNMMYKARKSKNQNNIQEINHNEFSLNNQDHKLNFKKSIPLFILAGFLANLLGIGGGIINTPSLNIVLSFPIHNSTAISTSIIFFTAIYNTVIKSFFGQIDYLIGLIIAIGSILGSILGAKISKKMPKVLLQLFVAVVLIVIALRMFFS